MTRLGFSPNGSPSLADFQAIQAKVGHPVDLPMFYQAFPAEPLMYGGQEALCANLQAQPSVAWQPTIPLGSVVRGGQDAALVAGARTAKSYGKPILVRLAHEFNGTWNAYGYGKENPESFIAGWVYVVEQFRAVGATNVRWCWCPNVWGAGSSTTDPTPYFPGDEHVDLVGLDGYMNLKTPAVTQFADLFLPGYKALTTLSGKPFTVGETGVAGDQRLSKSAWFAGMFETLTARMPRCESLHYFGRAMTSGEGDYTLDTSGTDRDALQTFQAALTASL